jgi:D-alanine-D-alanine ligase-like ATP-grasp enzyme/acylphosphatase
MPEVFSLEELILRYELNDYSGSPFNKIGGDTGSALICAEAERRQLRVQRHRRMIYEIISNDKRIVFRQNSPESSVVFTCCALEKHIAKAILSGNGIPVPAGGIFGDFESALEYFRQANCEVTVKPCDGSMGKGVTTGIGDERHLLEAWQFAIAESSKVIVEQNIRGHDVRVIVIGGQAVAAYVRIPAHVVGDGQSSIRALVQRKNARRRKNPSTRTDMISRFDLLEHQGISQDFVPERNQRIQLTSVANISAGGDTVQIFDQLSPDALGIAERAALCFPGLVQMGVDLILSSIADGPSAYVIEVNSNPGISDAVFPCYGRPVDVPAKLLEYLFATDIGCSMPELRISPARPYRWQSEGDAFSDGNLCQVELIKQAAYSLNVEVESLSEMVFALTHDRKRSTFYMGMPEAVRMVSRKVSRNRDWMQEILPKATGGADLQFGRGSGLNKYRILVVGDEIVAALWMRAGTGRDQDGGFTMRVDVSDRIHQSFIPHFKQTLKVTFFPFLAGIDMFAEDISADASRQYWKVINAVCNPALGRHQFPDEGIGRSVAAAIVEAIFPTLKGRTPEKRKVSMLVKDGMHKLWLQEWLKNTAVLYGAETQMKQLENGDLEIYLEGTPIAIEVLMGLFTSGPNSASVREVQLATDGRTDLHDFPVLQSR